MPKKDPRVDAYIARKPEFSHRILKHFRRLVHKACPKIDEDIKWGMPYFIYNGKILCGMTAFKQHCSFGFWRGGEMKDKHKIFDHVGETQMKFIKNIRSVEDLPSDKILTSYFREATKIYDNPETAKPKPKVKKELVIPDYFLKAIKKNKVAFKTFENFNYSHKREYVDWVTRAKTEPTREKRLKTTVEWLSEGKPHNWKYIKR